MKLKIVKDSNPIMRKRSEPVTLPLSIEDKEILDAIRCHTTGKPNMTTFEKLIYSADLLELGREEDFIVPLRVAMDKDFEEGFLTIVRQQYEYLKKEKGDNIYPLTVECAKYYLGI